MAMLYSHHKVRKQHLIAEDMELLGDSKHKQQFLKESKICNNATKQEVETDNVQLEIDGDGAIYTMKGKSYICASWRTHLQRVCF